MIETQVRLDAYRALLRLPDDDGLRRRSHLTQPGDADRHPRGWLRLVDAYTAWLGLQYDERRTYGECVLLENPSIVYETGPFSDTAWQDAQRLPKDRSRS